jgi:lipopolysaccharide transport system ATP-binding protein
MSNIAIKVENLSKIYRLGEIGTGTISRDMERWFKTKILKQDDPFLKIGERNDRSKKGSSDIVYSLQDINFEIQRGDAVGIIGRNGAGKSTLLKILSRVTTPTTGKINIKGRVASLLEVGTGFHPELTGRENIYLNGAILGMRKREIDRKLNEIIDFSGVERYIDTPVKRYSSGMYVRLAFAVTAFLESEILVVDEVLAVGDAEFQEKCISKMNEVGQKEGRTVLFVSHNLQSIKSLCNTGMLLAKGALINISNIDDIIKQYNFNISELLSQHRIFVEKSNDFQILQFGVKNTTKDFNSVLNRHDEMMIEFEYKNNTCYEGIYFNLKFKNQSGDFFLVTTSFSSDYHVLKGRQTVCVLIPAGFFNEGIFSIDLMALNFENFAYQDLMEIPDILTFEIVNIPLQLGQWSGKEVGYVQPKFMWI